MCYLCTLNSPARAMSVGAIMFPELYGALVCPIDGITVSIDSMVYVSNAPAALHTDQADHL